MKKKLGVCATEVPPDAQGTLAGNPHRIEAACKVIDSFRRWSDMIHLFAFPAGFLRARCEEEVLEASAPLLAHARATNFGVAFGVDTEPLKALPSSRVRDGTLPTFLVAWAPGMKAPVVWRQRSRTRTDARLAPDPTPRVLQVANWDVTPLIGGELANPEIRSGILSVHTELTILHAHFNAGQQHWAGMDALRKQGMCSIRTVHAQHGTSQMLCAYRGYRLCNVGWREAGIFCFGYYIDEDDRATDVDFAA